MLRFAVSHCEVRGCLNWRIEDKCILDTVLIPIERGIYISIQPVEICEAHRQFNETKLENLLED